MKISRVESDNATQKGMKLGAAAGFAGRIAYVAKKEGKDIFVNAGKEAVANGLKAKTGVLVKTGMIGAIAAAFAFGGAVIGAIVGKLIDNHNEKKQKQILIEKAFIDALNEVQTNETEKTDEIKENGEYDEAGEAEGLDISENIN